MILLLASTPAPEPGSTENFLWILAALLTIASMIWGFRRKPPIHAEFVTKEEFTGFKAEVRSELATINKASNQNAKDILQKLDEVRTEISTAGERRAIAIHNRINELQDSVARVDERTKKL